MCVYMCVCEMSIPYITAGDGQFQEVRRTIFHHLLKGHHIQTKVLYRNRGSYTLKKVYYFMSPQKENNPLI